MFCPSCKAEFVQGIALCSDCKLPLVATLDKEPEAQSLSVVAIGNYPDPAAADLVAEYLRSNGIEVLVSNEHTLGLNWLYTAALGGIGLAVREDQAEEAINLVASMVKEPSAEDEPNEFAGGHVEDEDLQRSRRANRLKALFTLLLTSPLVFLAALPLSRAGKGKDPTPDDSDGDA